MDGTIEKERIKERHRLEAAWGQVYPMKATRVPVVNGRQPPTTF